jgi:hypothetical protein
MGQYFEQGYGKAQDDWAENESALDILATPYGLAFCGWINTESAQQMGIRIQGRLVFENHVKFGLRGNFEARKISNPEQPLGCEDFKILITKEFSAV